MSENFAIRTKFDFRRNLPISAQFAPRLCKDVCPPLDAQVDEVRASARLFEFLTNWAHLHVSAMICSNCNQIM